jgi:hypothetical protein
MTVQRDTTLFPLTLDAGYFEGDGGVTSERSRISTSCRWPETLFAKAEIAPMTPPFAPFVGNGSLERAAAG